MTSFPIHLLLIIHLEKGSLVPPCAHMAGPPSPGLLHHLDKVVKYLVPRPRVLFLVPNPRSSFRIHVPRSGSLFLVPDLTYRFITPSPPLEKEALHTLGIIYTIILLTLVRVIPVLKLTIVSKSTFKGGVAQKKPPENLYHAQGTIRGLPGTGVLPVVRVSLIGKPIKSFFKNKVGR